MKKIYVEGDPKLKNTGGIQYSMVVGRFQPFHDGHKWLVNQCLNDGKNVLICIRDIEPNNENPFTSQEVRENVTNELLDLIRDEKVIVMVIPDIESINFGIIECLFNLSLPYCISILLFILCQMINRLIIF